MRQQTMKFLQWMFGSLGREAVRIGFTVAGIYIYIKHSPKIPKECDSEFFGLKTNSAEVFGAILVVFTGLGVALAMKLADVVIARFRKA